MNSAIHLEGITKSFGRVLANDRIDLEVAEGEIHAIVGENGAGKSTLMHILCGLIKPDAGDIRVRGLRMPPGKPDAALAAGIGLVAQHFSLVPTLTGWENVILGCEPVSRWGSVDRKAAISETQRLADKLEVDFPLDRPAESLPLSNRQMLEIIKALYRKAKVLVLDEPTSSLSPPEAVALFDRLHGLSQEGTTVLLVTHRIQEVLDHADRATVLRNGSVVSRLSSQNMNASDLVSAIVGEVGQASTVSHVSLNHRKTPILKLENLVVGMGETGEPGGLNLELYEGEILGIAGVAGNGQNRLLRSITGSSRATAGKLKFRGRDITELETPDRRKLGIAVVPEDRLAEGIIPQMTLRDNLILGNHERFSGALGLDRQEMDSFAQVLMRTFDIRADGCMQSVGSLSGGNQQKAVLARELSGNPDLLIAAQPSRGLDLNAKAFVHSQLRQVSSRNGAVLLISGDLEELMELSHRIAVLFRGKIVGEQDRENFKVSELGRMMTGRPEAPYERL